MACEISRRQFFLHQNPSHSYPHSKRKGVSAEQFEECRMSSFDMLRLGLEAITLDGKLRQYEK